MFSRSPVVKTRVTWTMMKNRSHVMTRKCSERAVWMLRTELTRRKRVDRAGDPPSPVMTARGPATNTLMK